MILFIKKTKNVSSEHDRWVVETQLCKLRDTSDTLIGGTRNISAIDRCIH